MVRDYSQFLPSTAKAGDKQSPNALKMLGWQPYFAQQVSVDDMTLTPPVRVVEVHRSGLRAVGDDIDTALPPAAEITIGDWLLLDRDDPGSSRLLQRKSLLKRRAPGTERKLQLIAANIDTAFIVSSCNQDLNVARLERYVALAFEADVAPVILLTKSDLCTSVDPYIADAQAISADVPVVALDARATEVKAQLDPWCRPGQTVAFLGSSGVGKTTLVNTLSGAQTLKTQAARSDDDRGRHTTTTRQLYMIPDSCAVLDTPGMRELQLTDVASGVETVFADLQAISAGCKFRDCAHLTEPGCAILDAIETGDIDHARVKRWQKLAAEERHNSANLLERRSKDKAFGKTIRQIQKHSKK